MTEPLSPATHAVLDAYADAPVSGRIALAAALRAAADQLGYGDGSGDPIINEYELLAIAAELEGE
jgi:hypothetical protein